MTSIHATEMLIFCMRSEGKVNKVEEDYLGVVVLGLFNAAIGSSDIRNGLVYCEGIVRVSLIKCLLLGDFSFVPEEFFCLKITPYFRGCCILCYFPFFQNFAQKIYK